MLASSVVFGAASRGTKRLVACHMRAEMLPGTGGGGLVFRFSRATGGVGH